MCWCEMTVCCHRLYFRLDLPPSRGEWVHVNVGDGRAGLVFV